MILYNESGIFQVKLYIHCNDFAHPLKNLLDCKSLHHGLCSYRNKFNEPENVKFSIRILFKSQIQHSWRQFKKLNSYDYPMIFQAHVDSTRPIQ